MRPTTGEPSIPNQDAFWVWPCVHYIGRFGQEHPDAALDALYRMTQRMSAEFDIRPFLKRSPELTLGRLAVWAADPSFGGDFEAAEVRLGKQPTNRGLPGP